MFTNEKKHKTILGSMEQKFFEEKVHMLRFKNDLKIIFH